MSKQRSKFLKENPDKHVWKRSDKFKSKPCELVKNFLTEQGILFVEEWSPLESRAYSIDIAFPDIKLGIEINGNQHYNMNGTLKKYYQDRHNQIVAAGWNLLEVHYSFCYNQDNLKSLISKWEQPDYSEYFNIKIKKQEEKIKNKAEAHGVKTKRKTDEKMIPKINLLIESDIDFSVFGWVKEAAKILNVKEQKVNGYMKRYAFDFYMDKCFKRKQKLT